MVKYRLATYKDNDQLLKLTSATAMPGTISLRIDRFPDFFRLNELRGETKVYAAEDNGLIIGCISVSRQNVYLLNKAHPMWYVSDLRVAATHQKKGIALGLVQETYKYLKRVEADILFVNVAEGNKRPFVFLCESASYPDFQSLGVFKVVQFLGSDKTNKSFEYQIRETKANNENIEFLNAYYSKYELASLITHDKVKNTQLFEVRYQDKLIAVMCLVDTMNMKQNVIVKLPWFLEKMVMVLNRMSLMLKISKLPQKNEAINMLYIKYLAVKDLNRDLISELITHAQHCAFLKSYSFVSIGLHEKDDLLKYLPLKIRFTFNSTGLIVSLKDNQDLLRKIINGVPYKDYSIV
ncbi:GNAT family N-acetyltransferase [Aestuariibaculum sediminum]|uniref:GNAT family N-acetyltransferase n=1 Tax=Aestuariibaculum sediminum TaxID=2770637 RepID=A0A8J6Q7B1_9FLAO|nr:GNAT family N-acetyltransferase [Aestuariibaculum sediminum]MBD0831575.1 GNAT family N-acetyltransferase [Aestuariibaculum sediminum]